MRRSYNTYLELELTCTGSMVAATKDYFDKGMEQWYPGDPGGLEDFQVFAGSGPNRVEITNTLSSKQLEQLRNEYTQWRCEQDAATRDGDL